jgi:peptidoglycan/LPS O-acetylase OafA/YrhL
MSAAGQPRRVYDTLDGLRAAGAQLVVVRHLGEYFGHFKVPESFLAVDLFYLVSGLVLANAYGQRLKGGKMSLWTFFLTRIVRLYPLYLLGLAIGLAAALLNMRHDPMSWWTPLKIFEAISTGLFLIPFVPGLLANGSSLDGPTWTLLPEIVANMFWAVTLRWVRIIAIGLALVLGGTGVIWAELHFRTLDVGFASDEVGAGIARAVYSFFAGVVVYTVVRDRRIDSNLVPWICVLILTAILGWQFGWPLLPKFKAAYEILCVLVVFPVLIGISACFEPGSRTARLFALIGRASWGVYILHEPVARLLEETVFPRGRMPAGVPVAVIGIGLLVLLNFLAWAFDRWFEVPVRKQLTAWLLPKPKTSVAA